MTMFRLFPSEERLRRALSAIVTTLDDEWAPYLGVAFRSYKLDMRIPPLARDGALSRFDRPTLVIGAGEDLSFPGERLLARAKELIPHAETELLANSKHSPPTDPASRARLGARIGEFLARAVAQPVDEPRPYGCV